ncbi:hypothetical protein MMC29_003028 [Sticta canariensis]|nr:hypothetical protein [Sticta canariensis]
MAKGSSSKGLPSRIARSILKIAGFGKIQASSQTPPLSPVDGSGNARFLDTLLVEILLLIVNRVDVVDQVCLQSTSQFFRQLIKIDRTALDGDRCRKWAITCRFETDMKKYPAKVACAFCKTHPGLISTPASPTRFSTGVGHDDVSSNESLVHRS